MTDQSGEPLAVVNGYLKCIEGHAPEQARGLLADSGFCYRSPILQFDSANDFLSYTAFSSGIIQKIDTRKVFLDGEDVCHWLIFHVQISEKMAIPIVQWAHVTAGRIARLEHLFDAHPYRTMFG